MNANLWPDEQKSHQVANEGKATRQVKAQKLEAQNTREEPEGAGHAGLASLSKREQAQRLLGGCRKRYSHTQLQTKDSHRPDTKHP